MIVVTLSLASQRTFPTSLIIILSIHHCDFTLLQAQFQICPNVQLALQAGGSENRWRLWLSIRTDGYQYTLDNFISGKGRRGGGGGGQPPPRK